MGEKPLYISHKAICMYYDQGNERNQEFILSLFFTGSVLKLIDFDQGSLSWDEGLKLISDLSQFSCPKHITYLMGESQNLDQISSSLFQFLTRFLWQVDFICPDSTFSL